MRMGRERVNKSGRFTGALVFAHAIKQKLTGALSNDRYFNVHEELLPPNTR